jgi:hypothetical protein
MVFKNGLDFHAHNVNLIESNKYYRHMDQVGDYNNLMSRMTYMAHIKKLG